jgi:two-component system nitrate/nitrite response regulator NarL
MAGKTKIAILDDHQGIIDGYLYRLGGESDIEVVATALYGDELEPMLAAHPVDVLILDVSVASSKENSNPFPILHQIPRLLQTYTSLSILVISMHAQQTLINAIMEAGASGYILKDDQASIRELASVIRTIAGGGVHLSQLAYQQLLKRHTGELGQPLSNRQLQALSLCAANPDANTSELAKMMDIAHSSMRNLLSGSYLKLKVRTRAAAVLKARQMGLISPDVPAPKI